MPMQFCAAWAFVVNVPIGNRQKKTGKKQSLLPRLSCHPVQQLLAFCLLVDIVLRVATY